VIELSVSMRLEKMRDRKVAADRDLQELQQTFIELENRLPNSPHLNPVYYPVWGGWGVATDGVQSHIFRPAETHASWLLGSAKSRHIEPSNWSAAKDWWWLSGQRVCRMFNLVQTNCVCSWSLLLHLLMLSENWVKFTHSCQMHHNFRCTDDLCN